MGNNESQCDFEIDGVSKESAAVIYKAAMKGRCKVCQNFSEYTVIAREQTINILKKYGFKVDTNSNSEKIDISWDKISVTPGNPYLYICNLAYTQDQEQKKQMILSVLKFAKILQDLVEKFQKKDSDWKFKFITVMSYDLRGYINEYDTHVRNPDFRKLLVDKCAEFGYKLWWPSGKFWSIHFKKPRLQPLSMN